PLPGRAGQRPASDGQEGGSADVVREQPRPIANQRLDRIGDPDPAIQESWVVSSWRLVSGRGSGTGSRWAGSSVGGGSSIGSMYTVRNCSPMLMASTSLRRRGSSVSPILPTRRRETSTLIRCSRGRGGAPPSRRPR